MPEPGAGCAVVCLKGRQREFGPSLELAPHVLYVGRAMSMGGWRLPKSDWANPFRAQSEGGAAVAVEKYADWLAGQPELLVRLPELSGRTLGCWCARGPCHARHLASLAARLVASRTQSPVSARPRVAGGVL